MFFVDLCGPLGSSSCGLLGSWQGEISAFVVRGRSAVEFLCCSSNYKLPSSRICKKHSGVHLQVLWQSDLLKSQKLKQHRGQSVVHMSK
jgi:hypothetical protein